MRPADWRSLRRFLRYLLVGGSTFLFDLALIWAMTEYLGVPYWLSTALGFAIAVSLNYVLSRRYVFRGTERPVYHGYAFFILFAVGGAAFIAGAVALLVTLFGLHYLLARVGIAAVVGLGNYLFNLHFNFRVAGLHL